MAQSLNIYPSNWHATGETVAIPQYEMTVRFEYVDDANEHCTDERTVTFSDALGSLDQDDRDELTRDILMFAARKLAGVDA